MTTQTRIAVIMEMTLSAKLDSSLIHQEQLAVIFPQSRELYMGGRVFTRFNDHERISYFLKESALNNRITPNRFNRKVRGSDDLYWLRVKLLQTPFNLDVRHIQTLEFGNLVNYRQAVRDKSILTIGPLYEGRYN